MVVEAAGGVSADIVAPVGVVVVLGDNRQMADDKKKAERHFNWQALKEAVERMKPELGAASEATHKHGAGDTPDDTDFDRTVALGYLVELRVCVAHTYGC